MNDEIKRLTKEYKRLAWKQLELENTDAYLNLEENAVTQHMILDEQITEVNDKIMELEKKVIILECQAEIKKLLGSLNDIMNYVMESKMSLKELQNTARLNNMKLAKLQLKLNNLLDEPKSSNKCIIQ